MNTSAKGSGAENFVAAYLEAKGYVVASRRKRKGGGDLLAVHPGGPILLVEVKGCKPSHLWQNFRRAQRKELLDTPLPPPFGEHLLALVRGSGENRKIDWYAPGEWPDAK